MHFNVNLKSENRLCVLCIWEISRIDTTIAIPGHAIKAYCNVTIRVRRKARLGMCCGDWLWCFLEKKRRCIRKKYLALRIRCIRILRYAVPYKTRCAYRTPFVRRCSLIHPVTLENTICVTWKAVRFGVDSWNNTNSWCAEPSGSGIEALQSINYLHKSRIIITFFKNFVSQFTFNLRSRLKFNSDFDRIEIMTRSSERRSTKSEEVNVTKWVQWSRDTDLQISKWETYSGNILTLLNYNCLSEYCLKFSRHISDMMYVLIKIQSMHNTHINVP